MTARPEPPPRRRRGRLAVALAFVALAIYAAPFAWLTVEQRRIVFEISTKAATPQAAGLAWAREVHVRTSDGQTLVAWFVPPTRGKPFLIYLHGNAGTLEKRAKRLAALTDDGAGLLAIEWRGYGGSTGSPSQAGLLKDATAAYDYARAAGADPARIVVVGESLGTGPAIWLAGHKEVAGLVLDSPYSSIVDIGAERYWMYPVRWAVRDPFPAIDWIGKAHVPIFAVAGEADRTIPIRYARRLMQAAAPPKTFIEVPGAGHIVLGRPEIMKKAKEFIARVAR